MADIPGTHSSCNGFEAWVVVDGQDLKQYGVECNALTQETSCWIPSETGKAFSIKYYRKKVDEYDYVASVYLDGHLVGAYTSLVIDGSAIQKISFIRISATEVRNFIFGSLELTDDDTLLENPFSSGNIGEIKVVFQRGKATESKSSTYIPDSIPKTGKVHERSKKGLAHQVKYGEVCRNKFVGGQWTVATHGVLATFTFKYRPLAMLQATGIVPRPSPPLEEDEPLHSLTPVETTKKRNISEVKQEVTDDEDEIDELHDDDDVLARERVLLAELEKIRNERRARKEDGRPKKKVKKEPVTYFTPGEVIDLT